MKKYCISSKNTVNYLLKHKENILGTGTENSATETWLISRKRKYEDVEKDTQMSSKGISRLPFRPTATSKGSSKKPEGERFFW